jgi:hypothetical protein
MTEKQKFYMVISDFVVIYNAFVKFKVCWGDSLYKGSKLRVVA